MNAGGGSDFAQKVCRGGHEGRYNAWNTKPANLHTWRDRKLFLLSNDRVSIVLPLPSDFNSDDLSGVVRT